MAQTGNDAISVAEARATIITPVTLTLPVVGEVRLVAADPRLRTPDRRQAMRPCDRGEAQQDCKAIIFDLP